MDLAPENFNSEDFYINNPPRCMKPNLSHLHIQRVPLLVMHGSIYNRSLAAITVVSQNSVLRNGSCMSAFYYKLLTR